MPSLLRFLAPRSIGQRFALAIGTGAGVILIVLATANYLHGRELLLAQASREAIKEAHDEIGNWDDLVDRLAMLPMAIATTQSTEEHGGGVSVPWLASLLKECPIKAVYGVYLILDSQDWRKTETFLFVDRKSWPGAQRLNYDFHDASHDWYRGARETRGTYITQPFFASGGSEIEMISITQAVRDTGGAFLGVAGVDVSLDEMSKIIQEMHVRDFGSAVFGSYQGIPRMGTKGLLPDNLQESAYMISRTGAVIISPKDDNVGRAPKPGEKNPDKILGNLKEHGLAVSDQDLQEILARDSGWLRLAAPEDTLICWAMSRTTGWKLILAIPYSLIVKPARDLAIESLILGGAGLILLLIVTLVVARRISIPIKNLQEIASNFEKGAYHEKDHRLETISRRSDELGRFAKSFSAMAQEIQLREKRLSEWSSHLEVTVKQRTADLELAMRAVEKTNAAMATEIAEASAYARAMLPARIKGKVTTDWAFETSSQLGGDSFGYHWLDEDHFALYLLDVCGHGVGAALLSVSVVNLLRTDSLTDTDFLDPSAVLSSLNDTFPMERHNDMYFTAWYGVYSCSSRRLDFACAGHPPALLLSPDGTKTELGAKGVIVGAFPSVRYESKSIVIPDGSRLYLFSDGAYEIDRPGKPMMTYDDLVEILLKTEGDNRIKRIVTTITQAQQSESFADDFSLVEFLFQSPGGSPP
jgi:serine phosphatase RsbU (regulator of sigma subunit)